jgi:hypothetical protein
LGCPLCGIKYNYVRKKGCIGIGAVFQLPNLKNHHSQVENTIKSGMEADLSNTSFVEGGTLVLYMGRPKTQHVLSDPTTQLNDRNVNGDDLA